MTTQNLSDQERAAAAVEFLIDSAAEYGAAKADAVFASNSLRRIKAMAMRASDAGSVAMKEAEAYASEAYLDALQAEFEAVKDYETLRAKREAAVQRIDYWRAINANQRAAERGYGSAR